MYSFEQQVRVMLEFRAMPSPVEISVPWNVLFYLDTHAERCVADDGMVVYRHPHPLSQVRSDRPGSAPALAVA